MIFIWPFDIWRGRSVRAQLYNSFRLFVILKPFLAADGLKLNPHMTWIYLLAMRDHSCRKCLSNGRSAKYLFFCSHMLTFILLLFHLNFAVWQNWYPAELLPLQLWLSNSVFLILCCGPNFINNEVVSANLCRHLSSFHHILCPEGRNPMRTAVPEVTYPVEDHWRLDSLS